MDQFWKYLTDIKSILAAVIIGLLTHTIIFILSYLLLDERDINNLDFAFFYAFFTLCLPSMLAVHIIKSSMKLLKAGNPVLYRYIVWPLVILSIPVVVLWILYLKKYSPVYEYFGEHADFYFVLFVSIYVLLTAFFYFLRIDLLWNRFGKEPAQ